MRACCIKITVEKQCAIFQACDPDQHCGLKVEVRENVQEILEKSLAIEFEKLIEKSDKQFQKKMNASREITLDSFPTCDKNNTRFTTRLAQKISSNARHCITDM